MKFCNFLLKCENATLVQNWNVLDTLEMMCLVLSKLPGNIREKWNRNVMNIRQRHLRELDFAKMSQFILLMTRQHWLVTHYFLKKP